MSFELHALNPSSLNLEIIWLSCADLSTALSKRQLQDIQIAQLSENLINYNFDYYSLPKTFINEIERENVSVLQVDGIEKLAKWEERLIELSSIFPKARICIGATPLKLPKDPSVIKDGACSSQRARSISPPPLRIEAASNNLSPIGRNYKFFPPKTGFSSFLREDHLLDSDIYTTFDANKRGIISELVNSSVAQGIVFFNGEKFQANFETSIDKKDASGSLLKECEELKDRMEGHFERKILLFYALTVACYKGFCSHFDESYLEIGETDYQIGKGDISKGLSGAHSSLIARVNLRFNPAILFDKFEHFNLDDQLKAYEESVSEIANYLSMQDLLTPFPTDIHLAKEWVKEMFKGFCSSYVPIESSLGQNLASTVCLPHFCNNLDSALEYCLRNDCILLLNEVFKGRKTPFEASQDFIGILHGALNRIKITYEEIKYNRDETRKCLKGLLDIFIGLNSPDYQSFITQFSKLYQNPLINPVVGITRLKPQIEKILSLSTTSYIEELKDLIRPDLLGLEIDSPEIFFDKKINIDPKQLPFDIMKRIYTSLITKLKIDLASIECLSEICLDFPQLFESDHQDETDEELLHHSLRAWFVDLLNSTIKGKHKIFLPSKGFNIELIKEALVKELKIIFDVDASVEPHQISFQKGLLKPLNELVGNATIQEKIHLIPIIDLYLEIIQFAPRQYQYYFQSSFDAKSVMTDEELMTAQTHLLKKKHNVHFSKLSNLGTDPNFLNVPIFFVLERVEDSLQYPNGLKLIIDKPEYFHTPHFNVQFKTYLSTSFGHELSLSIGDIKSGMFWL